MKKVLTLSVHQLVDFLLRVGDIDNRVYNATTMNEGTLIHAMYQARQNKNYISEYQLKDSFKVNGFEVILEGRADGIIKKSDSEFVIDEIKSTVIDLEEMIVRDKLNMLVVDQLSLMEDPTSKPGTPLRQVYGNISGA